jgi:excisionase family DNA binding protein
MARNDEIAVVLTRREAAAIARISLTALDEALRDGTFPSIRIGKRRVLIPRDSFMQILLAGARATIEKSSRSLSDPEDCF